MTPASPFQLLKRLGSLPVDPLVDALRELHQRGMTDSKQLQELISGGDVKPSSSDPPVISVAPAAPSPAGNYEAARRHFVDHARRLREQAMLTERLLANFARRQGVTLPAPVVHELSIVCAPGSQGSTRFVLVNTFDRTIAVHFRVERSHGISPVALSDKVSFDPPNPRLEPGREKTVRLCVDLQQWTPATDALEFAVDALSDDRLLLKLWVRVQIPGQEEA
jgi:hypothetical protein